MKISVISLCIDLEDFLLALPSENSIKPNEVLIERG